MVKVYLTNGFGNNLFQWCAAKLLAEVHDQELVVVPPYAGYYAIEDLEAVGVDFSKPENVFKYQDTILVNEQNYKSCFHPDLRNINFTVRGYFEDYTFFEAPRRVIKEWFPSVEKSNTEDLVIHFRAGDRLFYKNEFDSKPTVDNYLAAIEKFEFDKLHIVTDMPSWHRLDPEELAQMKFHFNVPADQRVSNQLAADYFNSFVDGFSKHCPVVTHRSIVEDFNFIRSFDKILFQHGTMGWWAAYLSDAAEVGVYGPWRPWKGVSNKNLSKIPLPGWFQWE